MSSALTRPMSMTEFLAWEECQELRWEFDGVRPIAMTGGTANRESIGNALRAILREKLAGTPCRVWGPTTKVEVAGRVRYPDAFVNCTRTSGSATVIPAPVVVFEVLSPGTSRTDRLEKMREYQATPSIMRYVIVEQDTIGATVYARRGDLWTAATLIDGDTLDMPEIAAAVAIAEIYADVELDADAK